MYVAAIVVGHMSSVIVLAEIETRMRCTVRDTGRHEHDLLQRCYGLGHFQHNAQCNARRKTRLKSLQE